MDQAKVISATTARNDFFNLIKQSYLKGKSFLVEKRDIPMVYIIPVNKVRDKNQPQLLSQINKLRNSMPETSDSVDLLREMRQD